MFRNFLILLPMALSAGCSDLDLHTAAALNRVDPLTADPADYALVLTLPQGLGIEPGSGRLTLAMSAGDEHVTQEVPLARDTSGNRATLFIAQNAHDPLRAFQASAKALRAQDPDGSKGEMSLHLTPCLIDGGPAPDAVISVAVRIGAGADPQPLIGPVRAQSYMDQIEKAADQPLVACESGA